MYEPFWLIISTHFYHFKPSLFYILYNTQKKGNLLTFHIMVINVFPSFDYLLLNSSLQQ